MSSGTTTTDHDAIRRWAEERGGKPAAVKATESKDDVGILRIDFPGYSGEAELEEISWDEWFEKFEEKKLALVVQEETKGGEPSRFNKLVRRSEGKTEGKASARSASSGGKTATKGHVKKTSKRSASAKHDARRA